MESYVSLSTNRGWYAVDVGIPQDGPQAALPRSTSRTRRTGHTRAAPRGWSWPSGAPPGSWPSSGTGETHQPAGYVRLPVPSSRSYLKDGAAGYAAHVPGAPARATFIVRTPKASEGSGHACYSYKISISLCRCKTISAMGEVLFMRFQRT